MSTARATTSAQPAAAPTSADRVRQVTVLVGAAVAIVGAAFGSGAFGGQAIQDAAGGALAADATPVAPDGPAFSIWSVIYLGLAVFAVYQAVPRQATDPRLRSVSWWVLASMLLNAAWIGVVQTGILPLSVVVIGVLVAVLAVILVRLVRTPPTSAVQTLVLDGTVGLYLGWASVATLANVAAALTDAGVGEGGLGATGWGVLVVAAGAVLAVAYALFAARRPVVAIGTGLAMAWGLGWIAYGRANGPLVDGTVAVAAGIAAGVALLAPVLTTLRARRG
ncbi:tryptophan-rich sensory protein [Oerskovia turbata]|uniref:Tryptophan-rich sensory protein n=1 Tax=Oerskovia turbata TaxID=1713 RepID=A0A4Q1KXQ1_9CELL|nr:tryptophan-rich sensory protein [Oerskovia turbata]RXR26767.1 tryptophan-rich sensory protein [Oerskovia turbata]RXR34500.1 tryptophan-rich sensory protein [Oerskovia turbata]